jgi:hypothetical protein
MLLTGATTIRFVTRVWARFARRNGNGFAAASPILVFQAGPSLLTDCAESETIGGTSELFLGRLLLASFGVQVYVYFLLGTIPLVPNPLLPNAIH